MESKKAISAALPVAIVVALILAVLGSYYVFSVLPGSLPGTVTSPNYAGPVSTLTGDYTSSGVSYVPVHSKMVNYSTIYINNGAADGREPAFNPVNTTVVIGQNNTVFFRNADSNQSMIYSPPSSANFSSPVLAPGGSFEFVFKTPGVYNYWDPLYPNNNGYENGTITVIS